MNITLNNDSNLVIELNNDKPEMIDSMLQYICYYENSRFMSEFAALYNNKYLPMAKWFSDKNVPEKDKEPYKEGFERANKTIDVLWNVLKKKGMTDEEIKNYIEIPF